MPGDGWRVVDVNAEVDRVMGELAAAGYEDEDDRALQPGEIRIHQGDGRLR